MKRKNKISFVIIIIVVFLLIIGTSYAYWRFTYIGNQTNIGKSKCLSIDLTNQKNEINLTNTYPISDEAGKKLTPYSFTVTNTCDTFISYNVNLEMLEGTTMNSKYMAVMINNEKKELLSNLEEASTAISSSTESRKLASGSLGSGDSVDYTLRLWMDESVSINDDAMNKVFTSKIVVTAEPNNYTPKDAGYDTLHDAILANEYQTTPEIAKEKILGKESSSIEGNNNGVYSIINTSPIIKWVEKNVDKGQTRRVIKIAESAINIDDATSSLTENDAKMSVYTTKKFNSETGRYTLSDRQYVDPSTLTFGGSTHYYYASEVIGCSSVTNKLYSGVGNEDITVYEIIGATKENTSTKWNNIEYASNTYILTTETLTETEFESDKSDKGLYEATDDYGITYYYRGNIKNNNVYFAVFYWQIVRINGDGSIRLMYNGSEKKATGIKQSINNEKYQFNSSSNKTAYIGYMYGNPDGTSFEEIHTNKISSTVKTVVDEWYKINIVDNEYSNFISSTVGFCGDRSLYNNSGGTGIDNSADTRFAAYGRYMSSMATFKCSETSRDLYTTADSNIGNKALTYPVGLITYDELVFAGIDVNHLNKLCWAYSATNYWTMSPSNFNAIGSLAAGWFQYDVGRLNGGWGWVGSDYGVRPVINLKPDVKINGGIGTVNDPYIIDTNN